MQKILITGAKGMLGKQFCASLRNLGVDPIEHCRDLANLEDAVKTYEYVKYVNPDVIIHCAALVGGIKANLEGGDSFYKINKSIDENVFRVAQSLEIKNLVYISSSCAYPSNRDVIIGVSEIGKEPIEESNRNYAQAKIEGMFKVQKIAKEQDFNWRVIIASNLYGPYDNFRTEAAHLIPSIIRKAIHAKKNKEKFIEMWGDGTPRREFTYGPELTMWISKSLSKLEEFPTIMNVGLGLDFTVRQYYEYVLEAIGYDAEIVPNNLLPNGTMRKLMDSSVAKKLGWQPKVLPKEGILKTLEWLNKKENYFASTGNK